MLTACERRSEEKILGKITFTTGTKFLTINKCLERAVSWRCPLVPTNIEKDANNKIGGEEKRWVATDEYIFQSILLIHISKHRQNMCRSIRRYIFRNIPSKYVPKHTVDTYFETYRQNMC